MDPIALLIGAVVGLVVGAGTAVFASRRRVANHLELERLKLSKAAEAEAIERSNADRKRLEDGLAHDRAQVDAEREDAKQRHDQLDRRAGKLDRLDDAISAREQALGDKAQSVERREARTLAREDQLSAQRDELQRQADALEQRNTALDDREREIEREAATLGERLEAIASLTQDEAREQLLAKLDHELAAEQSQLINQRLKEVEAGAKDQAVEIIARSIQRYAAEHTAETTTAKVELTDDDHKGRIIGKEGRNIRAFEQATGVDLIVDDTPGMITVSCFDGVRREIARRTLVELLEDGRVHPARIEEVLDRTRQDLDRQVQRMGEDAAFACDVSGLHPQILALLGKLQYRTSYGQNVLKHTQEVAFLCGALAADLGLDPKLGRRCGLLHDIGKALDHEHEGSHPQLGYEVLKRYGESETVANAALAHHEGYEVLTPYTTLAAAADAISAARPGARRDNVERYIKRLQAIEDIACSFKGVMKAYAIQAGREVRVLVDGSVLPDGSLSKVARAIARRIEDEVAYPGEVKVTVIREMRESALAR